ncbi:hypothetical protein [Pseudonocardia spinosispora]|uniref:hypothetical protein n=1 Tax=Pseudonocardia spinosispora TaxID=103441 RepID=UPI00048B6756|nr:hypothetical protein [Pseudonocardia spinosispora]
MTAEPSSPARQRGIRTLTATLVVLATLTGCAAEEPPPPPAPVQAIPVDPRVAKAPRNELQSGSWTIATDPETGINTALAGLPGAISQPASGGGTLHVYVVALVDGGSQQLSVGDLLGGADADPLIATINMARGANGTLTRNVPITVRGRYGADFRMVLVRSGKPQVMLGRMVFNPTKVIEITTVVPLADEAAVTPMHDYAADTIRIP